LWHGDLSTADKYPDWYIGSQPDGTVIAYTELCDPNPEVRQYPKWPTPGVQWRLEEYLFQFPSGPSRADGHYQLIVNGAVVADVSNWQSDCPGYPGTFSNLFIQDVPANFMPSGGEAFKDDVYIDSTWSRVYIANAPVLADATHRELQPVSSWSPSSITITQQMGSFQAGDAKWVFVVDAQNRASAGYRLT
jgi:hypothetical protein